MSEAATLAGRVAWITGGGSGIGLAGAIELARAGCRVVVSGRDAAKLDAAVSSATDAGAPRPDRSAPSRSTSPTGTRWPASPRASRPRTARVDILVNSAGVNYPKRYWAETDGATFEQVVAINLNGAAYCTLAVLAGMQRRGARHRRSTSRRSPAGT